MNKMEKSSRIYVAGHRGMVGSALCRVLQKMGYSELISRSSQEIDLRDQGQVSQFLKQEQLLFALLLFQFQLLPWVKMRKARGLLLSVLLLPTRHQLTVGPL